MAKKAATDGDSPASTVTETPVTETPLGEATANAGNAGGNGEAETPPQPQGSDSGNDDLRAALDRANVAIARLDEYEGSRAGYEKRLNDAQAAIDEFRAELVSWKEQLSAKDKVEAETKETIASMQTELAALRESLTTLSQTPATLNSPPDVSTSQSRQTVREVEEAARQTISSQASTQTPANQSGEGDGVGPKSTPQVAPQQPVSRKRLV